MKWPLWTDAEYRIAIKAYKKMLMLQLAGEKFVKSQHLREARDKLGRRSLASVKRRMSNISFVLKEFKLARLSGYKSLSHVRDDAMERMISIIQELTWPQANTDSK